MKRKLTSQAYESAKLFDETIKNVSRIFKHGGVQANIMEFADFGRELKSASLLVELSQDGVVSEETINRVFASTYENDPNREVRQKDLTKYYCEPAK